MIKRNKGFTLIELMIVVAIIGIIAMFALPSYQNAKRKTRIAEAIAQLTELQSQIEKARLTGRVPYNLIKLIDDPAQVGTQKDSDGKVTAFNILHDGKIKYNNTTIYTVVYTPAANATDKYTLTATLNGTWMPTNDSCSRLDLNGQGNLAQKAYCQK